MKLTEFDYDLPFERIAQHPLEERDASKMLVAPCGKARTKANAASEARAMCGQETTQKPTRFVDAHFRNLAEFLSAGDLLVFNQSKVVNARLLGERDSGGKVEAFLLAKVDAHTFRGLLKCSAKKEAGLQFTIGDEVQAKVIEADNENGIFTIRLDREVDSVLEIFGKTPLPPYITREAEGKDLSRYQTIYAATPGSVAAPTAGLHFTDKVLNEIQAAGVNVAYLDLHVGLGTFQPIKVENVNDHKMHSEIFSISEETAALVEQTKKNGGRVIAVGTTSLRALESSAALNRQKKVVPGVASTKLYVKPGDEFYVVDGLLTNFHQPKSSLLVLVAALMGFARMKQAYAHALAREYRFLSYGDCMLIV